MLASSIWRNCFLSVALIFLFCELENKITVSIYLITYFIYSRLWYGCTMWERGEDWKPYIYITMQADTYKQQLKFCIKHLLIFSDRICSPSPLNIFVYIFYIFQCLLYDRFLLPNISLLYDLSIIFQSEMVFNEIEY